jgi:hypothetical protein
VAQDHLFGEGTMGSDPDSLKRVVNAILGHKPSELGKGGAKKETDGKRPIVSKRDERGTPYRGDFPNPASDRTRGCF